MARGLTRCPAREGHGMSSASQLSLSQAKPSGLLVTRRQVGTASGQGPEQACHPRAAYQHICSQLCSPNFPPRFGNRQRLGGWAVAWSLRCIPGLCPTPPASHSPFPCHLLHPSALTHLDFPPPRTQTLPLVLRYPRSHVPPRDSDALTRAKAGVLFRRFLG